MTPGERQRLLAHLEMTESWLVSELAGLSKAQLAFKMTPESWSITEVVEHLAIAEPQYWQKVQDSMKQPATTEKLEATDAGIMWYGSTAPTARARARPVCRMASSQMSAESLASFRKLRATMTDYAKTTKEELRTHKLLEGNMDVYQWFLMISSHSQRHILQIREIKAHARFPKT